MTVLSVADKYAQANDESAQAMNFVRVMLAMHSYKFHFSVLFSFWLKAM